MNIPSPEDCSDRMMSVHLVYTSPTSCVWRKPMFKHDSERIYAESVNDVVHANPFGDDNERLQNAALAVELPAEVLELNLPAPVMPEFQEFAVIVQRARCLAEACRRR